MKQTSPATVTDGLHATAIVFLSRKKNTAPANMPIDTIQKVIPTRSFVCNRVVAALAGFVIPKKAKAAITTILRFFMKPFFFQFSFLTSLNSNHPEQDYLPLSEHIKHTILEKKVNLKPFFNKIIKEALVLLNFCFFQ